MRILFLCFWALISGAICYKMALLCIRIAWRNYGNRLRRCVPLTTESAWMLALGAELVTPPNTAGIALQWTWLWAISIFLAGVVGL